MSRIWNGLSEFRTSRVGVIVFYGYLVAILLSGALVARALVDLHDLANQNHRVLCNQKLTYQRSLRIAVGYLKQHPNGTAEFSRGLIVSSIADDRFQLKAFNDVDCQS